MMIKKIFDLNNIWKVIIFATIPGLIFYVVAFIVMQYNGFHTMEIVRDFAQQMHKSSFLGFLSSIGTWLWVSSVAIALFGFFTLKNEVLFRQRELLLLLGVFSLLLAVDDFFMIHDRYINQNICYATYAILALAMMSRHYKIIIEINAFAFIFAGMLLAASIFTDLIQDDIPFRYSHIQRVEEGFKFTGAATWLYFVALVASFYEIKPANAESKEVN